MYHLMQRRTPLRFADTSVFIICVFSMSMTTRLQIKNVDIVLFMRDTVCSVWGSDWIFLYSLFFLFQLNTHIYHHLLLTCFGVCSTIFRQTIALLAQKLYAFCNIAKKHTITTSFVPYTNYSIHTVQIKLCPALRYKPEGREFDSRWCYWNFHWRNPSVALCTWGRLSLNRNEYRRAQRPGILRGISWMIGIC